MSNQHKLSKTIKFRLTEEEFNALTMYVANNPGTSLSSVIRDAIFNSNNIISFALREELVRQRLYNLILRAKISEPAKNSIIEELNRL